MISIIVLLSFKSKFFLVIYSNIIRYHADYEPGKPKEIADMQNDDGKLYNLENFSNHDLNRDMNHICIYIFGLSRIVFDDSINSMFWVSFVIYHEFPNVKYLGALENSHDLDKVKVLL